MHSSHSRLASSLLPSLPPASLSLSVRPSRFRPPPPLFYSALTAVVVVRPSLAVGVISVTATEAAATSSVRPSTAFSLRAPTSASSSSSSSSRTLSLNLIKEHSNPPEDCHSCDLCTCLAASFYFLLSFPLPSAPLYFTPTTSAFLFLIPSCFFET